MGRTWSEEGHRKAKSKSFVRGRGHNDVYHCNRHERAYEAWKGMFDRCYNPAIHERNPTYIGCYVCEEWMFYSNFRKWYYEHFHKGVIQELDKDILIKGNKVYSPETCCLVPHRINCLLEKSDAKRGDLPIGVILDKERGGYSSSMRMFGTCQIIGNFDTPEKAFQAYKLTKENYIKLVAGLYYTRGFIERRVYDALLNYQVDIND